MVIASIIIFLLGLISVFVFAVTVVGIILHLRTTFKGKEVLKE